jgi:hypothetical protein
MKTRLSRSISLLLAVILFFMAQPSSAQNTFPSTGSAGIGTATPDTSAILELKSTKKGLLVPRMTVIQRNAIVKPAKGLLIYQTNNTPGFYYFDTTWKTFISSVPASANQTLSNLSKPTSLNQSLNVSADDSFSLGSTSKRWRNVNLYQLNFANGTSQSTAYIPYTAGTGINISGTTITNLSPTQWTTAGGNVVYAPGDALIHGVTVGVGSGSVFSNTVVGNQALNSNTTGYDNTADGFEALNSNTTGNDNTATGKTALIYNTTGADNTADGAGALTYNTTGSNNTASGSQSLYSNTTGSYNNAYGYGSLYSNTTGSYNNADGYVSLHYNTTGNDNTAEGYSALYSNTTGNDNTANGFFALTNNTTGYDNTADGSGTLNNNYTGSYNTAEGYNALAGNITGNNNTATGYQALPSNTNGADNTAVGFQSLNNSISSYNTAVGYEALYTNTTGYNMTAVGINADVNFGGWANVSLFGQGATGTASNQVRIGGSSVTSIGGYAGWTNISDGRVKTNIKQNVPGLAFINQLQPITYNLDLNAIDKIIQPAVHKDSSGNALKPSSGELAARTAKEQVVYTGFIAQDVEKAAKSVNYDFSGVDPAKNSKDLYGLRYAEFVVPLVKAVQAL